MEFSTPISLGTSELILVNTGKPSTMTGECVMAVRNRFKDSEIWT